MIHAVKMPDNGVKVDLYGSYTDIDLEIQALEVAIKDYKDSKKELKEELQ